MPTLPAVDPIPSSNDLPGLVQKVITGMGSGRHTDVIGKNAHQRTHGEGIIGRLPIARKGNEAVFLMNIGDEQSFF